MSRTETDPEYSSVQYAVTSRPSGDRNLMYMSDEQRRRYWGGQKHTENMEANEKQIKSDVKKCSKCGQTKHIDNFGRHPRSKDGYLSECKSCRGTKSAASSHNIETQVKDMIDAIPLPERNEAQTAEQLTDKALADELRRRGYDVRATKTIEI